MRERFEDFVFPDPNSGCFIWAARSDSHGYGRFRIGRVAGKEQYVGAHRFAFELANGRAAVGGVLHRCDTPSCVNPDHLREGSQAVNARDMQQRERGRKSKMGLPYGVQQQPEAWGGGYSARISVDKKRYYLGLFSTIEEAARMAADCRDKILKGELQ